MKPCDKLEKNWFTGGSVQSEHDPKALPVAETAVKWD